MLRSLLVAACAAVASATVELTPDNFDEVVFASGKAAFEDVKQNVNAQATTRMIFMPNSASLTVDGRLLKSGDDIIAGDSLSWA